MLAAVLLCGLAPFSAPEARAASWADEYLNTLVSWGVMRGDIEGNLYPEREITRAEFVTLINRAYGYEELGETPFEDVLSSDWYAEDIGIAYRTGYFTGTSETTASPTKNLTREEAAVLMGRNMMLRPGVGEALSFSDSREFGEWSRGMIDQVAASGVVTGHTDGSFRPKNNITRGEVAAMLVRAIGTLIQDSGDYKLGGVYGNLTVNTSGVTLRDTVIAGDLYLTGGVGLGDVKLENVTVLGKIVAAGAGESQKGESSILLRNVQADEMVVDSISNQFVTLLAQGDTSIGTTSVRTSAYLEDATTAGLGLQLIELDGESGITLDLSGNIKEVVNLTPSSELRLTQGIAAQVTVDEKAVDSTLNIDNSAMIRQLNLDVGTTVTGTGDISQLNVNAPGCTVSMLPDSITIRPGITADIAGETMDTVTAAESSEDPRLLAGYPAARDVAPKQALAVFSTNKRGTVYWAVSALGDGSVEEEELISPPTYATKILQSGTVAVGSSNTEVSADITGLISDGSYYLSAVLVDSRDQRSPVKVTAFTTPDDSTPAFASGYPYMSKITNTSGQVTVMPTKSCQLYYALLEKGAAAPTAQEFKTAAVSGNLGYGSLDVTKNVSLSFEVNSRLLDEEADYDLYLWLTDYDGAKSSAVKKLSFTTVDGTPPVIISGPTMTRQQERTVSFEVTINEDATFYWAVVTTGTEYPKPLAGQTGEVKLESETAKMQVASGIGALNSGKPAASANRVVTFTIGNLDAESSYDMYYVAQDKAGNYSAQVQKLSFNTLDENSPAAAIEFTDYNESDPTRPLANTDIIIRFSERVQTYPDGELLDELYTNVTQSTAYSPAQEAAREEMAAVLKQVITFYDLTGGDENLAKVRPDDGLDPWNIDYRYAQITVEDGCTVITLPTEDYESESALNLSSGGTYRFDITGLSDTSRNQMGSLQLPGKAGFTTVFAQVNMKALDASVVEGYIDYDGVKQDTDVTSHMGFTLQPVSTTKVDQSIKWDMVIWTDSTMEFQLYRRKLDGDGVPQTSWQELGPAPYRVIVGYDSQMQGASLITNFDQYGQTLVTYPDLCDPVLMDDTNALYEYAIHIASIGPLEDDKDWNTTVNMRVGLVAGGNIELGNLAANLTPVNWDAMVDGSSLTSIGNVVATGSDELELKRIFDDKQAPVFYEGAPEFQDIDDSSVNMVLKLSRAGTIYYQVAPASVVTPAGTITVKELEDSGEVDDNGDPIMTIKTSTQTVTWDKLPGNGSGTVDSSGNPVPTASDGTMLTIEQPTLTIPTVEQITSGRDASNQRVFWGTVAGDTTSINYPLGSSERPLEADTEYVAYFVIKGTANVYSDEVYVYGFKTEPVITPVIDLALNNPSVNIDAVDRDAIVDGLLILEDAGYINQQIIGKKMEGYIDDATAKAQYGSLTILEAMEQMLSQGNEKIGTVFDLYANQTVKDEVARYIRSQTAGTVNIVYKMDSTVVEKDNEDVWVNCNDYMSPGAARYIFLAVGRNEQGTSGDGFRAIRPMFRRDTEWPMVTSVSGAMTVRPANGLYQGTPTVTFSEPIYEWQDSTSSSLATMKAIVAKDFGATVGDDEKAVGALLSADGLYSSVSVKVPASGGSGALTSVTLEVRDLGVGDAVRLDSTMLCDAQGNTNRNVLTLTLRLDENGAAYFEVNEAWDDTGS